jgi:O-acetylhomoserine/O-acetylserine sulfhydrylase-like pyridoxal-dependent enzyme
MAHPQPATLALHADDALNNVTDVAPPIHLSTTFRYSDNPEELAPIADLSVCTRK